MQEAIDVFIQRWGSAGGTERANYQLFLTELCRLLDIPQPDPAGDDTRDNAYVFERRVDIHHPDGTNTLGFIDLYRRGSFVCEAKQSGKTLDTSGWDRAMLKAQNQADLYARSLPANEGRPPFILVTDVGRNIELYSEFSRSGATYTPFPDVLSHRIRLEDLRNDEIRDRLRAVWLDPQSLDPSRHAARVTRDIADNLAMLAKSLEADGHPPEDVSGFLMRALFTMFAEDVGLLPDHTFTELLDSLRNDPTSFAPMLESLWTSMNSGGFSPILRKTILRFNGGLFRDPKAIALTRDQFDLLLNASRADWEYVEPAIFGTLLERALNPRERHKLGAHYTPRAYVERLVLPTIIEPLRNEWQEVQAAALTYEQQGKTKLAREEIRSFHRHLCTVRVLDPACGSGNFLYVTLEHLKRLEGEVLNLLHDLGESRTLETEGLTVDPHQFLGLEINPRAAKIAEMVLWIGYLQWHFRTMGHVNPPEPVLRDFKNIENRDALIDYDSVEHVLDAAGAEVTRWDGVTYKVSPVTGEDIPDESAQVAQYNYVAPRKAEWPQADYIIGNPPFIGASTMRGTLGDGYVEAVRGAWSEVPESADFVMYWWHIAAETVRHGQCKRFGFITTNSIRQTLNRRVVQTHLDAKRPLALVHVIPDHPWVDSSDGAAVRIAMTIGEAGLREGVLLQVRNEHRTMEDEIEVDLNSVSGLIYSDLKVGINVSGAQRLEAMAGLAIKGFELGNQGFLVENAQALRVLDGNLLTARVLKPYMNGSQLVDGVQRFYVIDLHGFTEIEIREQFPELYQIVNDRVREHRLINRESRTASKWWLFRRSGQALRSAVVGLDHFIATTRTAKHRVFQFLSSSVVAESKIVVIALQSDVALGYLSSRIHCHWAMSAGAWLGVGNDSTYNHTDCFETFPLPETPPQLQQRIAEVARTLDTHRKRQQKLHEGLSLTDMYNVLEKLRSGEALTVKEKTIHEQGLVSVLRELHDELDHAVFAAYGWEDLSKQLVGLPGATTPLPNKTEAQAEAENELLSRLVTLNAQRAAEESRGHIRWLRPEYQNPSAVIASEQAEVEFVQEETAATKPQGKSTWPKNMREQVAVVRKALQPTSMTAVDIAQQFKRSPVVAVQSVLDALQDLGMVELENGRYRIQG